MPAGRSRSWSTGCPPASANTACSVSCPRTPISPKPQSVAVPAQDRDFDGSLDTQAPRQRSAACGPLRLLEKPEEIKSSAASVPDGPPQRFHWRQCQSRRGARRRPGTHRHGMVARKSAQAPDSGSNEAAIKLNCLRSLAAQPGLFPRRNARGKRFWLYRDGQHLHNDLGAALVSAWHVRMSYAELAVTTNYSFLRGASHPGQFVAAGAMRSAMPPSASPTATAWRAWCAPMTPGSKLKPGAPPRLLVGARLVFRDGTPDILAYPQDRAAYGRLCQLLSLGQIARAQRRMLSAIWPIFMEYRDGLAADRDAASRTWKAHRPLLTQFDGPVWLAASMLYTGEDRRRLRDLRSWRERPARA